MRVTRVDRCWGIGARPPQDEVLSAVTGSFILTIRGSSHAKPQGRKQNAAYWMEALPKASTQKPIPNPQNLSSRIPDVLRLWCFCYWFFAVEAAARTLFMASGRHMVAGLC